MHFKIGDIVRAHVMRGEETVAYTGVIKNIESEALPLIWVYYKTEENKNVLDIFTEGRLELDTIDIENSIGEMELI